MRSPILALVVVAGSLAAVSTTPAAACSIRGQYCGYPAWAANAFEHPRGRVILGSGPNLPTIDGRPYVERPRHHSRHYHHRRHKR